jgi:hypothetical protein
LRSLNAVIRGLCELSGLDEKQSYAGDIYVTSQNSNTVSVIDPNG